MLLQDEGGVLRVFPDWPGERDASFTTLRAKGAFLVSSELRGGKIRYIEIASQTGGPLVIASPWGSERVRVARSKELLRPEQGLITLHTVRGEHYYLTPADGASLGTAE